MPSIQKIAVVTCLALMSTAKPTRSFPRDGDAVILVEPTMYQIFPLAPSQSGPAVSQLEVQRTDDVSTLENIAVFSGIPAGAKSCLLGWTQAAVAERTEFTVSGNGLLASQQLPRLPGGDVSWESIVPIAEEAVAGGWPLLHPDTTSWPEVETAAGHIAGFVDCAETIYLKIQIDDRDTDGSVYLGQDAKNGLTLEVQ